MFKVSRIAVWAALVAALAASQALAQSSCSSDGEARPVALLERFINADCESCWSDPATPKPEPGTLALDWIVPGSKGNDAPLSAAASRDGLARLQALHKPAPSAAESVQSKSARTGRRLRVAHGLAFNGYIGASIELKPGGGGPWQAWLALVETIPAGAEGTPLERNLVRNLLRQDWDRPRALSRQERRKLFDSRAMNIPEGAQPSRLRVVGWVEDAAGHIKTIAQSRCDAPSDKG